MMDRDKLIKLTEYRDDYRVTQWGEWQVYFEQPGMKLKILYVEPGQSLSLQYHNYRSELWTVMSGTGKYFLSSIKGDEQLNQLKKDLLDNFDSVFSPLFPGLQLHIPQYWHHMIINDGEKPLIIAEVQLGKCSEDDIVRETIHEI